MAKGSKTFAGFRQSPSLVSREMLRNPILRIASTKIYNPCIGLLIDQDILCLRITPDYIVFV
ncbi:hypothetical protein BDW62DRAFT_115285 [Aspergillus aurantiobrunneus]